MTVGDGVPFLGHESAISIAKQATNTTFVTSGAFIEFNSESFTQNREEIKLTSINSTRDIKKRLIGNEALEMSIESDLDLASDGLINILKQAMGGTVSSAIGSTGVYTHTFNTGDMENNAASAGASDMKSLSIGIRKGSTNTWEVAGCRVNSLNIKGEIGSPVVLSAELIANSVTAATSIGAAAVSISQVLPVNFTGVTIKTGDSITNLGAECFTSFEFALSNGLDGDQRKLGTRNVAQIPPGMRELTCNLAQRFDTMTAINRYLQNTLTAIEITLDNEQTIASNSPLTYQAIIKLPEAYWNTTQPEVGGPETLAHETEVTALYNASAAYSVQMTVRNGTAAYD